MQLKSLVLALVAGLAAFLVVGVAVTELVQSWIEFSLFLGIPAGLGAGAFVAALVYLWLADDVPAQRQRVAITFASFGVAFLVILLAISIVLDMGTTLTLIVATVVGIMAAIAAYVGGETERPAARQSR